MAQSAGRLLLVDDEPQLIRVLVPALSAAGFVVETATTAASALSMLAADGYDALLVDLGLPDMDGKEIIAKLREWSDIAIVVLSARDQEIEKVAALDLGADDFVNKPFSIGELLARLRASLRGRELRFASQQDFRAGDLRVNFASRRVFVMGEEIHLTPHEFNLVRCLARNSGAVATHKQLMLAVWGPDANADAQFVRVLVSQVRQKVEEDPSTPRIILTELGVGYRLVSDDAAEATAPAAGAR